MRPTIPDSQIGCRTLRDRVTHLRRIRAWDLLSASQHELEKAIAFYTKAIEVDPQLGEAHYRLGVAYDRIGSPEKAKQEFQLHDEIEKRQAVAVERQRREVKQFLVVLQGQPVTPPAH